MKAPVYVSVKDLPEFLVNILKNELRYHAKDIGVQPGTSTSLHAPSGDGYRAFVVVVNLGTKEHKTIMGSWGGANMFNPNNPVDLDTKIYEIPQDGLVIHGTEGGGKPVWASITVHPDSMPKMLPDESSEQLTPQELYVLYHYKSTKSAFRSERFKRYNIGSDVIDGLVKKKYLQRSASGATQITTKGKNKAPYSEYEATKQLSEKTPTDGKTFAEIAQTIGFDLYNT